MKSRVAPRKPRQINRPLQMNDPAYQREYYILSKERLDEIRLEKMYPFFDKDSFGGNGDLVKEINDNSAQVQKQLNFLLPFFGFGFNYTWVQFTCRSHPVIHWIRFLRLLDFNPRLSRLQWFHGVISVTAASVPSADLAEGQGSFVYQSVLQPLPCRPQQRERRR